MNIIAGFRYIAVQYKIILHRAQQPHGMNSFQLLPHDDIPYFTIMGELLGVFPLGKMTPISEAHCIYDEV